MAQQQSQKSSALGNLPRAGDKFRCQQCGMEVEVTQDCNCQQDKPRLECCGKPLSQA